ncbi:hypothetical protein [Bradyrhizobium elkanii]|uniref:hypothetical protein n=1 Tax=Bradyrhizobium elkanii TaxID=29448 RepID=UPI0004AFA1E9|nr:hypothetical protein [Bradyrhizobium elkanii]WLA85194.1 hypothetical protein QNJ99_13790 [Bradyrhizobium elkanii]
MSGNVGNWRVELTEAHRDLFQPPVDFPGAAKGSPECDVGWRELLDRLCVRIAGIVQADGGVIKFSQIKQKYGTLRVYWDGALAPDADAQVEDAIALAEARSAATCEVCGEEGRLRDGAWLTTRCEAHSEGRPPVEHRSGLENVHLVRHFADGRRFVTCRRYDRQNDVFVDVDPASLVIEE